jgi:hypothetical protein
MGLRDNLLIVEGKDDLRVVPELIERAGVPWGPRGAEIVRIHEIDGYANLAAQLRSQLKNAGLLRVGIIVDANSDPVARWQSISATLSPEYALPAAPPPAGFVAPLTGSTKRLGVWMMPDNAARGMMETFLLALRPASNAPLLAHAEGAVDAARQSHGAPFSAAHRDKAIIHTWLAWQDPPGRQMHDAVKQAMLDATLPYAGPFTAWFKQLYELT